jgi:hypothetical protein
MRFKAGLVRRRSGWRTSTKFRLESARRKSDPRSARDDEHRPREKHDGDRETQVPKAMTRHDLVKLCAQI